MISFPLTEDQKTELHHLVWTAEQTACSDGFQAVLARYFMDTLRISIINSDAFTPDQKDALLEAPGDIAKLVIEVRKNFQLKENS